MIALKEAVLNYVSDISDLQNVEHFYFIIFKCLRILIRNSCHIFQSNV